MADPNAMAQTMRNNIKEKTGKTASQWQAILKKADAQKHGELVKLLKQNHGVTHGFANLIVSDYLKANVNETQADVDLVALQYQGDKARLKPMYDAIINALTKQCPELEIAPKKAYVSLRHKKQFALLKPSTKTRLDVGINFKEVEPSGRLEASGSFNSMVSHRVRLTDIAQVDDELIEYLLNAYNEAG